MNIYSPRFKPEKRPNSGYLKVQLSEFTGVTYGSAGEELLIGREMTQEYMDQQRYTPTQVAALES